MAARELVNDAIAQKMLETGGRTPWQTMKAKLSVDIRCRGPASPFVRTAPGRFHLRRLLDSSDEVFEAERLTPPPSRERVLAFRSASLDICHRFQGISRDASSRLSTLLGDYGVHMDRLIAEQDDDHKQVLTYIMVTRGDQILRYQRGSYNRVEDSLRGLACVGFGGHVRAEDHDLTSVEDYGVRRSAARELREELTLPEGDARRLEVLEGLEVLGVLNDDSSPVGRRHFAVLFRYEVADSHSWDEPKRGEKSITQLRWLDVRSDDVSLERFEYWSQLCLREFYGPLVQGRPTYLIRRRRPLRPPHILCVLGEIGSGKTETTKQLTHDFGYAEVNSGAAVAELLGRDPITPPREDERLAFQEEARAFIRSPDGPTRLAEAIWERAVATGADRVLVDGIRQQATLDALRARASGHSIGLLYVYTPPDVAFDFYRARRGRSTTIHDFVAVREAEVEIEVRDLISHADAVLYNWAGKRNFRAMVRTLMKELGVARR